jgi:glucose-6-phosphate isomerase
MAALIESDEWKSLVAHVSEVQTTHLRDLLQDDARNQALIREFNGVYLDFSRQNATQKTIQVRQLGCNLYLSHIPPTSFQP